MKKHHTPAGTCLAQTTYELTAEEVICALVEYVDKGTVMVPQGKRSVRVRDASSPADGPLATLVVDHEEEDNQGASRRPDNG